MLKILKTYMLQQKCKYMFCTGYTQLIFHGYRDFQVQHLRAVAKTNINTLK